MIHSRVFALLVGLVFTLEHAVNGLVPPSSATRASVHLANNFLPLFPPNEKILDSSTSSASLIKSRSRSQSSTAVSVGANTESDTPSRKQFTPRLRSVLFSRKTAILGTTAIIASLVSSSICGLPGILSGLKHSRKFVKPLAQVVVVLGILYNLHQWRAVKRRQAIDATSEWGRYAKYPGARGRALVLVALRAALARLRAKYSTGSNETILEQSGEGLTTGLLQLGPLYIKLGQILSCRQNLMPPQWIKAMERLQDQVPAQSGRDAWALAEAAWPHDSATNARSFNETFSDFNDKPLAAASLGQVHVAKLRETGDVVAIKLQRPYLREMYDQDFALLTKMAQMIDNLGSRRRSKGSRSVGDVGGIKQNWTEIFLDAEAILYREIDYRDEAENAVRFCSDFGLGLNGTATKTSKTDQAGDLLPSAAPWLRTPFCYANISSEKVLVSEFVPSIKITNWKKLEAAGVTEADKIYLADSLARAYLRQFCCHFFFSTDPHPGNLGVEVLDPEATNPSDRVRIVFYDFGQAATLAPSQGEGILEIVEAIVDSDVDKSIESFEKMRVLQPDADLAVVRAKIAENYKTGKVKANRKRMKRRGYKFKKTSEKSEVPANSTRTSAEVPEDKTVMKFFKLPPGYAFVARALSQLDGVGKGLDTDFDFISAAAPFIYEIKGAKRYIKEEIIKRLESIPYRLQKIFPRQYYSRKDKERQLLSDNSSPV